MFDRTQSATEFRYNVIGWMVGGVSLVIGRPIDRRSIAFAATLTALIVLIG